MRKGKEGRPDRIALSQPLPESTEAPGSRPMKRWRQLRHRPPPSQFGDRLAPIRRQVNQKPRLTLPWNIRRVTLAYAKRHLDELFANARMGAVIFIKLRGGGRSAGAYLIHVPGALDPASEAPETAP